MGTVWQGYNRHDGDVHREREARGLGRAFPWSGSPPVEIEDESGEETPQEEKHERPGDEPRDAR